MEERESPERQHRGELRRVELESFGIANFRGRALAARLRLGNIALFFCVLSFYEEKTGSPREAHTFVEEREYFELLASWRGHGFEKYNVKSVSIDFSLLHSDSYSRAGAMYFTLLFYSIPPSVIVSILTFRLADAIVWACVCGEELLVSVLIFCLGFISPSPSESDFFAIFCYCSLHWSEYFFTIKETLCGVLVH